MQQTQNLPSSNSAETNLPQSSLTSQDKIASAIQSFGDDYQNLIFCKYQKPTGIERAVSDTAPTFHDCTNFFGESATLFWLRFHIAETFAFLGIYDTASKFQVQQTANLILSHNIYGQLTFPEFLCFLRRFKRGDYGKIYQSSRPNPQEFLMCLQPFWNEISYYRGKKAERERLERLSHDRKDPDNMTYKEWEEIKMLTPPFG